MLPLFVISMPPLSHIVKKCTGSNKFTKLQWNINHLFVHERHQPIFKNWKRTGDLDTSKRTYNLDKRMKFDRKKMWYDDEKSGKREITEGIELPNQESVRPLG